jgi:hypothetical protein
MCSLFSATKVPNVVLAYYMYVHIYVDASWHPLVTPVFNFIVLVITLSFHVLLFATFPRQQGSSCIEFMPFFSQVIHTEHSPQH